MRACVTNVHTSETFDIEKGPQLDSYLFVIFNVILTIDNVLQGFQGSSNPTSVLTLAVPLLSESQRPTSKRRKRKGSTSGPGNNAPPAPSKKRSPGPNFSLASQVC